MIQHFRFSNNLNQRSSPILQIINTLLDSSLNLITIYIQMSYHAPSSNEALQNQYYNPPLPAPNRINLANFTYPDNLDTEHAVELTEQQQRQRLPDNADFADFSTKINCKRCKRISMTNVQLYSGKATWFWCIVLCPFFGAGCCCLCLDTCKDKVHYCSCGDEAGKRPSSIC